MKENIVGIMPLVYLHSICTGQLIKNDQVKA